MIDMLYRIWSKTLTFIGDIKFFGWKHPLWFIINATHDRITGESYRIISKIIKPGDILLARSEEYLSTMLIPGYWTHCGFYFGGPQERVIHAVSDGVVIEDIINFMRTDELIILRPEEKYVERAMLLAKSMINQTYDFLFDFTDENRISCSELIYCCYYQLIVPQKRFGKPTVVADDIANSRNFSIIWDSRNSNI